MFESSPPESPQETPRHYAGVLISVEPARFTEVRRLLDATPGVAVHHLDAGTGRCVAVLETKDRAEGERLFAAVGRLPHVHSVDLVYHLVDRAAAGASAASRASDAPADTDSDAAFLEPKP